METESEGETPAKQAKARHEKLKNRNKGKRVHRGQEVITSVHKGQGERILTPNNSGRE